MCRPLNVGPRPGACAITTNILMRLIQSLEAWERRQARATARQFPDEAVGALEALGYRVTAPSA